MLCLDKVYHNTFRITTKQNELYFHKIRIESGHFRNENKQISNICVIIQETEILHHNTIIQGDTHMNLFDLCTSIDMPSEVMETVVTLSKYLPKSHLLQAITQPENARDSYFELKELSDNIYKQLQKQLTTIDFPLKKSYLHTENGLTVLTFMLQAALHTYEIYRSKNITDSIFFDTMKCFSRFVNEHKQSFGVYGFDRAWWTYRQLSLVLFRVGELEYGFRDDQQEIHIHVSSDAMIDLESCRSSHDSMVDFVHTHFPDKADYEYTLNSWLLSPALDNLLDPNSRILRLKNCFKIVHWDKENTEFLQWVYGRIDIPYESLPEKTSLQKNLKRYLLNGGTVGCAKGTLDTFS